MWVPIFTTLARVLVGRMPRWGQCAEPQPAVTSPTTPVIERCPFGRHCPSISCTYRGGVGPDNKFKRWLHHHGLNAVYIKRSKEDANGSDPLQPLSTAGEWQIVDYFSRKAHAIRAKCRACSVGHLSFGQTPNLQRRIHPRLSGNLRPHHAQGEFGPRLWPVPHVLQTFLLFARGRGQE